MLNVRAQWRATAALGGPRLFADVRNALGARYETAGLLGDARGVPLSELEGREPAEGPRVLTLGAPRALRLGIEVQL